MSASVYVVCSVLNFFYLFLLFTAVTTNYNATSYNLNTTAFTDQNLIYNVTDSSAAPEFEFTTPTPSSSSTEDPVTPTVPGEPLPASGRLLTPGTSGNFCFWLPLWLKLFNVISQPHKH